MPQSFTNAFGTPVDAVIRIVSPKLTHIKTPQQSAAHTITRIHFLILYIENNKTVQIRLFITIMKIKFDAISFLANVPKGNDTKIHSALEILLLIANAHNNHDNERCAKNINIAYFI